MASRKLWTTWQRFPICFMALATTVGCGQVQNRSAEFDVRQVEAVSQARAEAFNRSDAQTIASHFSDDCVLMAPDKPAARGREAVRSYYQSIFDVYSPVLESGYEEVRVSGDLAFGRGFATVRLTPKNGGPTTVSTAKYLNILRRQSDGTWKTTHDIWNSNEPTPSTQ
ncbi:MAG: SgcJ/EcaC family oxidoreductase [Acidobacteriota bacterium]